MVERRLIIGITGGVNTDMAPGSMPANTLRGADGWQLRGDGQGGVLTPDEYEQLLTALPDGLSPVGSKETPMGLFLLLRHHSGSQGCIAIYADGALTILLDDTPSSVKLNFPDTRIKIELKQDVPSRVDLYWSDGVNPPRVYRLGSPPPSVHSLAQQPEVTWGAAVYLGYTTGTLLQGYYCYAFRYRNAHTTSGVSPVSTLLTVTKAPAFGETPASMGASGIATKRGFSVRLDDVDRRWTRLDLLIAYSPDNSSWTDFVVASTIELVSVNGTSATLSATSNEGTGQGVTMNDVLTYYRPVQRAGAMALRDNRLYFGDVTSFNPVSPVNLDSPPVLSVLNEYQPVETLGLPTKQAIMASTGVEAAQRTPLAQNIPVNTPLSNTLYKDKLGNPVVRQLPVSAEAHDYSGSSFAHNRMDYRAEESYPVGVLPFDNLGQPTFVHPIGTFTVPALYDSEGKTAPTRLNPDGSVDVRHVGLQVDNLLIADEALRDPSGRLVVSGLSIVRGAASGAIGPQGVALNTVGELGGRPDTLASLPTWANIFADNTTVAPMLTNGVPPSSGGVLVKNPQGASTAFSPYTMDAKLLTFHSPDLNVDGSRLTSDTSGVELETLGAIRPASNALRGVQVQQQGWHQYLVRGYYYDRDGKRPTAQGRASAGATASVEHRWAIPATNEEDLLGKGFYRDNLDLDFSAISYPFFFHPDTTLNSDNRIMFGQARTGAGYLLQLDRQLLVDVGLSLNQPVGYMLANLRRTVGITPPDQVRYQPTGHYLPVTEALLADLPVVMIGGKKHYRLDGIHVWGGDTFRQRTGLVLQSPAFTADGQQTWEPPHDPDYGIGLLAVLENSLNQQLRTGRRWETVGFESQKQAFRGEAPWMSGGVSGSQPEDWNVNAGLNGKETLRKYERIPVDSQLNSAWQQAIVWSKTAIDTERWDSLLRIPATNIVLLDGEYGPINGLHPLEIGLYATQPGAVSGIPTNERVTTTTDSGDVVLAAGREVGPHQIKTRLSGPALAGHTWQGDTNTFYWLDKHTGDLHRFTQAGVDNLSLLKGVRQTSVSPPSPTTYGAYHTERKLAYVATASGTLLFDELLNSFLTLPPLPNTKLLPGTFGGLCLFDPGRRLLVSPGSRLPYLLNLRAEACFTRGVDTHFDYLRVICSESLYRCLSGIVLGQGDRSSTITPTDRRLKWAGGTLYVPLRGLTGAAFYNDRLLITLYLNIPVPSPGHEKPVLADLHLSHLEVIARLPS